MEKKVIKNYIKKWNEKDDQNIKELKKRYKLWIKDNEEKEICIKLLENFEYYGRQRVNFYLEKLHEKLIHDHNISDENTVYSIIKSENGRANSSMEYFIEYTQINKVSRNNRIEDIARMNKKMKRPKVNQIVLIDDCIGTGETIKKYIEMYKEDLKDKKIYILVIYAIKEITDKLEKEFLEKGYHIEIICLNKKTKAFTKEIFKDKDEKEIQEIKEKFIQLSKNHNIPENYELGFGKTEGLVAFYNNTPNNTLGIFWVDNDNNIALFPRNRDSNRIGLKELKENRIKRSIENYKNRGRKIG